MLKPRLRDSKKSRESDIHPLGEFPKALIYEISKWIVYHFAVGKADISGEDWGDIFAKGVKGVHLSSPIGLADVVLDEGAWSVKSVKNDSPHDCKTIRVISGRNSPDYSYGIANPHDDPQRPAVVCQGDSSVRYYLCPKEVIPVEAVQEDWGLLWLCGGRVMVKKRAPRRTATIPMLEDELAVMWCLLRDGLECYLPEEARA